MALNEISGGRSSIWGLMGAGHSLKTNPTSEIIRLTAIDGGTGKHLIMAPPFIYTVGRIVCKGKQIAAMD